jgi:hypothetical protein
MSTIAQSILLSIVTQALQAGAGFCTKASAMTTSPVGKLAYQYGGTFCGNMAKLTGYGQVATTAEFTAENLAEKTYVAAQNTLPPIA